MQPYSRANNQGEEVTVEKDRQRRALFQEVKMSAPRRQSTRLSACARSIPECDRRVFLILPHVAETMVGGADATPLNCYGLAILYGGILRHSYAPIYNSTAHLRACMGHQNTLLIPPVYKIKSWPRRRAGRKDRRAAKLAGNVLVGGGGRGTPANLHGS
jgi:hypothetical protein